MKLSRDRRPPQPRLPAGRYNELPHGPFESRQNQVQAIVEDDGVGFDTEAVLAMTSIDLLVTEPGRLATPVGRIDFYALPVQKGHDFVCTPRDIVSFSEAQAVSVRLSQGGVVGGIGRYTWRMIT
jgi:hypothetical protein